jgi:hypothetical protein
MATPAAGIAPFFARPHKIALLPKDIRSYWEQMFTNTAYIAINLDIIATELVNNIPYVVTIENILQVVGGRRIEA